MSLVLRTTTQSDDAAKFAADSILSQIQSGKRVLLFLARGSAIAVAVKIADILKGHPHSNLCVTLTDERYGPISHPDSNLFQLVQNGFDLPEAKMIPVLVGEDLNVTTQKFNQALDSELKVAEYKIGLFGIGADGHTAGILPDSPAVQSNDLAYGYNTPTFSRITITPEVIKKMDEAIVWMQGEDKWSAIKSLKKDIDISKQPAQILKQVSLLTIFTDFKE